MPSIKNIPDNKRRSRTGCLPCRKRRRKCDEQKPVCSSCTARSFSCIYARPTFIYEHQYGDGSTFEAGIHASRTTRLHGGGHSHSPPIPPADHTEPPVIREVQQPVASSDGDSVSLSFDRFPAQVAPSAPPTSGSGLDWTPPSAGTQIDHTIDPPRSSYAVDSVEDVGTDYLTSFVNEIVPWVVSTCPGSRFANSIIDLAERQPALRSAMIALVKTRKKAIHAINGREVFEEQDDRYQSTAEEALDRMGNTLALHVGKSLLSITRLFGSSTRSWSTIKGNYILSNGGLDEPLRYLLQMQGKIELASCILNRTPPSESLLSYLEQSASAPKSHSGIRNAYLECLSQLARCLHLSYQGLAQWTAVFHNPCQNDSPTRASSMNTTAEAYTAWHSLWNKCVYWYEARPPEMEPILGLSSFEASSESAASFPIEIYSTPIALQSNMAIHLCFIALIAHKPRLLKLPRTQVHLGSQSWHTQKIAGMAVWNSFKEQFDPLFTAALITAAENMTHKSQQIALLDVLRDIECKMGIVLDDHIGRLGAIWQTFSHDQR